jgi:hypothetical protein
MGLLLGCCCCAHMFQQRALRELATYLATINLCVRKNEQPYVQHSLD